MKINFSCQNTKSRQVKNLFFVEFVAMMNDANPWIWIIDALVAKNCNRESFLYEFERELVKMRVIIVMWMKLVCE